MLFVPQPLHEAGGEEGSVLIHLFQWLCQTGAGPASRAQSPLPVDVSEAELVGNSGPYSGCEEDPSLVKVTATACSVHAPSPPALVPLCL